MFCPPFCGLENGKTFVCEQIKSKLEIARNTTANDLDDFFIFNLYQK